MNGELISFLRTEWDDRPSVIVLTEAKPEDESERNKYTRKENGSKTENDTETAWEVAEFLNVFIREMPSDDDLETLTCVF